MITTSKKLIGAICSIGMICGVLSQAKAAIVEVTLDWGSTFGAKDSAGVVLSTASTTLSLGTIDNVPANWSSINLSNLADSFNNLSTLDFQGANYQYLFSIDTTLVNEDPAAQAQAFLVVISGNTQLGIFSWNKGATPFYLPRDPDPYVTDDTSLATNYGRVNKYNMSALLGTISASGITTVSSTVPGSAAADQSITFGAIPSKSVGDSFALAATATSGLPVSYSSTNLSVATIEGNVVRIVGVGSVEIIASQSGNSSYAPVTARQSVTTYPSTTLRMVSLGTPVLSGGQTSVIHTFVGNPNSTYTIEYKSDLSASTWSTLSATTGGSGTFSATFTATGDYVNAWKNRMFFRAKNS